MISKEDRDKITETQKANILDSLFYWWESLDQDVIESFGNVNVFDLVHNSLTAEDEPKKFATMEEVFPEFTAEDEAKCIPVRGVNCKECSAYFMDLIKHHKEHHTAKDGCNHTMCHNPDCPDCYPVTDKKVFTTTENIAAEDKCNAIWESARMMSFERFRYWYNAITVEDECDHEWEEVAVDWYRCKKCGAKDYPAEDEHES